MQNIEVKGFGYYVPKQIITNDQLEELVDTNDEWISTRTGIKQRRISKGEDTSDLSIEAALDVLKKTKMSGEDIDIIIVATVTPDNFTPSVSCMVQKAIGAKKALAFDINAACSGFVFAFQTAVSLLNSDECYKNALIIGAEVLSKIVDWSDRSTCVLFGDGAGASIISKSKESKRLSFYSKSVGEKGEALLCGAREVKNAFIEDAIPKFNYINMEGRQVFKFATSAMVEAIEKLLQKEDLSLNDIDYIIPHQANYRIINFVAKKMNIPLEKIYINLDRYANTSSASIPIALGEMQDKKMLKKKMKIIIVGFGGGLTFGSALIEI